MWVGHQTSIEGMERSLNLVRQSALESFVVLCFNRSTDGTKLRNTPDGVRGLRSARPHQARVRSLVASDLISLFPTLLATRLLVSSIVFLSARYHERLSF